MTNLLPVDFAKAIHNSSDRQRFTIKDRDYGDTVCEVFASPHSKYLLHRHALPFSFQLSDISTDSECYKPMKERGYKYCVYIPFDSDSEKLQKIFKGLIAFKPILYNSEDHHKELKHQLYQTMINMPYNTQFTLETGDGGYNSVIVRREALYIVLSTKLVPGAEVKPNLFDFELVQKQSNYDATDYKTSIGISSYSSHIDKLLEGVVCIRLKPSDKQVGITFKSEVTTTKESTDNMIEFNINHDVKEAMEYTFKHLHALPHNATIILQDQNGFKYPGTIHKTNLVHAIFTQARCGNDKTDYSHQEIKDEYGATGYIGIGVFYSKIFSRHLKYINSIFIKEEDMNPKDISNGPILNNTISTGAKKMSKLVVKEIVLKEISEAGLRRHMPSIVTDLGYELDKDTGNTMWPQNSEIDLTATPINITPASVKEIIVSKIKEEPAEDSKWMNIARKYNLIQSVILKEKDAKA